MKICDKCRSGDDVMKMFIPSKPDQGRGDLPLLASFDHNDMCKKCRERLVALINDFMVEDPPMSRTKENGLWAWLRDGAPRDCVLERVENSIAIGFPDAVGCWQRHAFVLELKSVARPASGIIDCELKPEQASFLRRWAKAGGRAYVLVQVGQAHEAKRYLIFARDCLELLKSIKESRLGVLSAIDDECATQIDIFNWIC